MRVANIRQRKQRYVSSSAEHRASADAVTGIPQTATMTAGGYQIWLPGEGWTCRLSCPFQSAENSTVGGGLGAGQHLPQPTKANGTGAPMRAAKGSGGPQHRLKGLQDGTQGDLCRSNQSLIQRSLRKSGRNLSRSMVRAHRRLDDVQRTRCVRLAIDGPGCCMQVEPAIFCESVCSSK